MNFLITTGNAIAAEKKETAERERDGDALIPADEIKMEVDDEDDSDSDDPASKIQILDATEIKEESDESSSEDELFLIQKFPSEL